jgi:hypothetical protein
MNVSHSAAQQERIKKGSPVHVAPAYAGSEEGFDHFGPYVRILSLHFCKRMFLGLEPMTSLSQGNSFTAAPGLTFHSKNACTLIFRQQNIIRHDEI